MIGAERLNQFKQVAHKILRPLELTISAIEERRRLGQAKDQEE